MSHDLRHTPQPLALYRLAVQHPQAEADFLLRAYQHEHDEPPLLLREDFAGTAAVAAAWVALDPEHQAMAVELDEPTLQWAQDHVRQPLGKRTQDLHLVHADVLALHRPHVDVVAALNFSTFIYHRRDALLNYFRHARRCLRPDGVLVIDAFGGPGAMRLGVQRRRVQPGIPGMPAFDYLWEQHSFDALTHRIDCRIHFEWSDGRSLRDAFRYDWRLWTLPELTELMHQAGFARVAVWCDEVDPAIGQSRGSFEPRQSIPAREDWVAYLVGRRA